MAKRQKTGKTLALFDVDGTLTVPRKVRRERLEVAFSRVHETTPDTTSHSAAIGLRRARASTTRTHPRPSRDLPMLEQKADDTMLKFMKDLQEVRRRGPRRRATRDRPRGPIEAAFPCSFMGTSFVGFSRSLFGRASLPSSLSSRAAGIPA